MANTISKSKDSVSYLKVPFQHSNGKVWQKFKIVKIFLSKEHELA